MGITRIVQSKAKVLFFIVVLLVFSIGKTVLAEGGGGTGSGGGKTEPLALISSSINNGATGIALKPTIVLTFSKNIVNMQVVENNKNCFSLQTEDGKKVPINLFLADDQIEFEKRNDAVITTVDNLYPGTTYFIVVSGTLTSKSGVTTGKETRISFTTEGKKQEVNNDSTSDVKPKPKPKPEESAPKKNESVTAKNNQITNQENKSNASESSNTDKKPSAEQPTSNKNDENNDDADADIQIEEDSVENETIASEIEKPQSVPYEKSVASADEAVENTSNGNNPYIYLFSIIGVVIIASIIIYFYKRKQSKNSA